MHFFTVTSVTNLPGTSVGDGELVGKKHALPSWYPHTNYWWGLIAKRYLGVKGEYLFALFCMGRMGENRFDPSCERTVFLSAATASQVGSDFTNQRHQCNVENSAQEQHGNKQENLNQYNKILLTRYTWSDYDLMSKRLSELLQGTGILYRHIALESLIHQSNLIDSSRPKNVGTTIALSFSNHDCRLWRNSMSAMMRKICRFALLGWVIRFLCRNVHLYSSFPLTRVN